MDFHDIAPDRVQLVSVWDQFRLYGLRMRYFVYLNEIPRGGKALLSRTRRAGPHWKPVARLIRWWWGNRWLLTRRSWAVPRAGMALCPGTVPEIPWEARPTERAFQYLCVSGGSQSERASGPFTSKTGSLGSS